MPVDDRDPSDRAINEGALIPEDDSFVTLYRLASENE